MIVASDGFAHFGRFLELCGAPVSKIAATPESANIQFFTEYGFKESLCDGAENRYRDPGVRAAPDLVVYVENIPAVLLGVEAKVFHRPPPGDLPQQLETQAELLSVMAEGLGTQPAIHQVALLPAGFDAANQIGNVPVLTWERVADTFRDVAPAYWISVLDEALSRYGNLVSKAGSGDTYRQNNDDVLVGKEIYNRFKTGDKTYTWMGRDRGRHGPELQADLKTGRWKTQPYEVRHKQINGNRNWFEIESFIKAIDLR